jgi:hypothetical protein
MVILIIQVKDFSFGLVDFERDPPITGDGEAPDSFAVAGELVGVPARYVAELSGIFHLLQESQNIPDLLHDRGAKPEASLFSMKRLTPWWATFRIFIK